MLFIPSAKAGNGIGHLRRCLELLTEFPDGALLVDSLQSSEADRIRRVAKSIGVPVSDAKLIRASEAGGQWRTVVLDRRSTTSSELERFSAYGPVVALDEGGEARRLAPYLIDTLPLPRGAARANVSSTAFQIPPKLRRSSGDSQTGQALITFGGEDRMGLSSRLAKFLVNGRYFDAERLTVVRGPLFEAQSFPEGVRLLDSPDNLRDRLHEFDIVFTSFGLTAYEAANAGVAVVLFNPTAYHRTLSRIARFAEVGVRRVRRSSLRSLLADRASVLETSSRVACGEQRSISEHLAGLDFSRAGGCPACGSFERTSVGRFPDRSFFRCGECSIVYELDFSPGRRRYDEAYFFEDYRKQYGKTYLEDFDAIRRFGAARLDRMEALGTILEGKRLLDVGCAYGAFLLEASGRGATVFGIDVAESAIDYVATELSLACRRTSIEELDLQADFSQRSVDIVTMWYVIEHLPRLGSALEKINRMLKLGGTFAFSTPNLAGVSGRRDMQRFLENSPYDHFTIWDPRIARRVLARHGFRVRKTQVTGHHPERFRHAGAGGGLRYSMLRRYSRLAQLGDTFECYAEKVSEQEQ